MLIVTIKMLIMMLTVQQSATWDKSRKRGELAFSLSLVETLCLRCKGKKMFGFTLFENIFCTLLLGLDETVSDKQKAFKVRRTWDLRVKDVCGKIKPQLMWIFKIIMLGMLYWEYGTDTNPGCALKHLCWFSAQEAFYR